MSEATRLPVKEEGTGGEYTDKQQTEVEEGWAG